LLSGFFRFLISSITQYDEEKYEPMKNVSLFVLLLFLSFSTLPGQENPRKNPGWVRITFVAHDDDPAQTFIGKLKRGDMETLRWELNRYNGGVPAEENDPYSRESGERSVEHIVSSGPKKVNPEKRKEKARNDLFENYSIRDEESRKKIREKKQKADEQRFESSKNYQNDRELSDGQGRSTSTPLSKYYRVSKHRIRNGQSFRKPAGDVSFIVTFRIREGRYVNTYMNLVRGYLNPGSEYLLKYHGTGSKRSYYLEYVPSTTR